jgi:hypothetical protein
VAGIETRIWDGDVKLGDDDAQQLARMSDSDLENLFAPRSGVFAAALVAWFDKPRGRLISETAPSDTRLPPYLRDQLDEWVAIIRQVAEIDQTGEALVDWAVERLEHHQFRIVRAAMRTPNALNNDVRAALSHRAPTLMLGPISRLLAELLFALNEPSVDVALRDRFAGAGRDEGTRSALLEGVVASSTTPATVGELLGLAQSDGAFSDFMGRLLLADLDHKVFDPTGTAFFENLATFRSFLADASQIAAALTEGPAIKVHIALLASLYPDRRVPERLAVDLLTSDKSQVRAAAGGYLSLHHFYDHAPTLLTHHDVAVVGRGVARSSRRSYVGRRQALCSALLDVWSRLQDGPIEFDVAGYDNGVLRQDRVAKVVLEHYDGRSAEQLIDVARSGDPATRSAWVKCVDGPTATSAEVDFLIELLGGRASDPQSAASAKLKRCAIDHAHVVAIADLVGKPASRVRLAALAVLASLGGEERAAAIIELRSGNAHQQTAADDLDGQPTPHDMFEGDVDESPGKAAGTTLREDERPAMPAGWPHDGSNWVPELLASLDAELTRRNNVEVESAEDPKRTLLIGMDPIGVSSVSTPTPSTFVKLVDEQLAPIFAAVVDPLMKAGRTDEVVSGLSAAMGVLQDLRVRGMHFRSDDDLVEEAMRRLAPEAEAVGPLDHPRLLSVVLPMLFGPLTHEDRWWSALARGTVAAAIIADDIAQETGRHCAPRFPFDNWQRAARRSRGGPLPLEAVDILCPLARWQRSDGGGSRRAQRPDFELLIDASTFGLLTKTDMRAWIDDHGATTRSSNGSREIAELTALHRRGNAELAALFEVVDELREEVVAGECSRRDLPVATTPVVKSLGSIEGAQTLARLLSRLGDRPFWRSDYSDDHCEATLSHLIQISHPGNGETPADLRNALREVGVSIDRMLAVSMFAPQWAAFGESLLRWRGLEDAVWWWHGHTRDSNWRVPRELRRQWAAALATRTGLQERQLALGEVDIEWFRRAHRSVGATRWSELADLAKLTSPRNGHRAAVDASNALIAGDAAVLKVAIEDRRDQRAMRCIGLAPLPKAHKARLDEVVARRRVLLRVLDTIAKRSSQRAASESTAVEAGLANLATNAGYRDVGRMNWVVEAREASDLASGKLSASVAGAIVAVDVDAEGNVGLRIERHGKQLTSVPADLRKHVDIVALDARHKELRKVTSRVRTALETSMVEGDRFSSADLADIYAHPVVAPVARLLTLIDDSNDFGVMTSAGRFFDAEGDRWKPDGKLRLAHVTDLATSGSWQVWQRHTFAHRRRQPFKQVFRELYVPTEAEAGESALALSRRYEGHAVKRRQATALLASRGWSIDRRGGATRYFASCGWSAEVTIADPWDWFGSEHVELGSVRWWGSTRGSSTGVEGVPPIVFSETMRDLDLVVSVAHRGGSTPPDASRSAIEVRAALVREVARLFEIDVRTDGQWVAINGTRATYRVHLGSGSTHIAAGRALMINPVRRTGRGRIFLPFIDDDPKAAEIVTTVVTLGQDAEIKDASLLAQIERR